VQSFLWVIGNNDVSGPKVEVVYRDEASALTLQPLREDTPALITALAALQKK
jgi:hypothetical protein